MARDRDSIVDIIHAIQEIFTAMAGVSFTQLSSNREKQAAILYFLIIIGEATKRTSKEFRAKYTDIDWQGMAGMRDILAHQYDRVDVRVIWDVVQTDLRPLLLALQAILADL